jgi:hypothetical protein
LRHDERQKHQTANGVMNAMMPRDISRLDPCLARRELATAVVASETHHENAEACDQNEQCSNTSRQTALDRSQGADPESNHAQRER